MVKLLSMLVILCLNLIAAVPSSASASGTNFYVSPAGNDKNSGTLSSPLRTVQQCARKAKSGDTCNLRKGTYAETVTPNSGVTFQSYKGERVVIDGRNLIDGFTPFRPNQYVAPVDLTLGDQNQVFFDEAPGSIAKWPNGGDDFHPNWATLKSGTSSTTLKDPDLPTTLIGSGLAKIWSGNDAWSAQTAAFDKQTLGSLDITLDGSRPDEQITPKLGGLYYLFDNLSLLDSDFEWFFDQKTKKLYVQIPQGKSISDYKIKFKKRTTAFNLNARNHVSIKNIAIIGATITSDAKSSYNLIDGIDASYISSYTRLRDDKIFHPWQGGFDFDHNFDTGIMLKGSHNILQNSKINNSVCNGVLVTGSYNLVVNNLISNVNTLFNNCSGIYLVGDHQTVTRNTVYNTGRSAIFPTNVWHPVDNPKSLAPTNVEISYNDLFNTALLGNDIGAIYLGGGVFTGMKIDHNWIHDSHFPSVKPASPWPQNNISGVYLDENSAGAEIFQNVLWSLDFRSIFVNGGNRTDHANDNLIHNNSIPDAGKYAEIHLGGPISLCGTTRVFDNRVLIDVKQEFGTSCKADNNTSQAPGATEMDGVQPGCRLSACTVDPFKPTSW